MIDGAWGKDPVPVDARGWGWMTKGYVSGNYKRPFWNKAKELLFSGEQVTSYTISSFDPDFYCEVRKHYGFVWFEMQHSTMSWDEVAKMIAACPGPDGAAPMIRMPDQLESLSETVASDRLAVSAQPLGGGEDVGTVAEEADPAVTRGDAVLDGGAGAPRVVGDDRVRVEEGRRPVDEHQSGRTARRRCTAIAPRSARTRCRSCSCSR